MNHHRNLERDGITTERARRKPDQTGGLAGPRAEKTVSLALQGGGAHGAFTWGVLDALLEDGRLAIEAITGASAGGRPARRAKSTTGSTKSPSTAICCANYGRWRSSSG